MLTADDKVDPVGGPPAKSSKGWRAAVVQAVADATLKARLVLTPDQDSGILTLVGLMARHAAAAEAGELKHHRSKYIPKGYLSLTGPAGSGKTTILRVIAQAAEAMGYRVAFCAPTGKAASRMREAFPDGDVSTVHGMIYGRPAESAVCPECKADSQRLAKAIAELTARNLPRQCESCKAVIPKDVVVPTHLAFQATDGVMEPRDLWVVDEASMITGTMHRDLMEKLRGGVLLYVGDPNQLPPVEDDGEQGMPHPELLEPTVALTRVHRQGANSPVLDAAHRVLAGVGAELLKQGGRGEFQIVRCGIDGMAKRIAESVAIGEDSVALVAANTTRAALNERTRDLLVPKLKTLPDGFLLLGERLVCVANNHKVGVMNGDLLTVAGSAARYDGKFTEIVTSTGESYWILTECLGKEFREYSYACRKERDRYKEAEEEWLLSGYKTHPKLSDYLRALRVPDMGRCLHVHFGYALTVHKSQGSAWNHVFYVWDKAVFAKAKHNPEEFKRHVYTGITRASERVTVFVAPFERKG